jgi:uncharacterized protein (TIGR02611 family)
VTDGPRDTGQVGTNPDIRPAIVPPEADEQPESRESAESGESPEGAEGAEPPLRHPFRQFFARHRTLDVTYRVAVAVIGAAVVVGGIILIPLPGPGWLIVFGGLAILATEFEWAGRLLDFARRKVLGWTHWVGRQSLVVRGLIGLAGLLVVGGVLWTYVALQGVPALLPFG